MISKTAILERRIQPGTVRQWTDAPVVESVDDPKIERLNYLATVGKFDRLTNGKIWKPQGIVTNAQGKTELYTAMIQAEESDLFITLSSCQRPHSRRFLVESNGLVYMEDERTGKTIPVNPLGSVEFKSKYHDTIMTLVRTRAEFTKSGRLVAMISDSEIPPPVMGLVWDFNKREWDFEVVA